MSIRAEAQPRAAAVRPRARGTGSLAERQTGLAWALLTPALLVVVLVALVPLVQTISQSFTDARLASARPAQVVGVKNYTDLLQDGGFLNSIKVTIEFTVLTVVFEFVLGMIIALVVNSNFPGRGPMRAAMLVPWAIPTVVSASMWKWMYNDTYGVVNDLLIRLHIINSNVAWI